MKDSPSLNERKDPEVEGIESTHAKRSETTRSYCNGGME